VTVRIHVEKGRCQGHAQCAALAPDLFVLDDLGYLALADVVVDDDDAPTARRGALACPEGAITILEEA
jgi:ferredoxin